MAFVRSLKANGYIDLCSDEEHQHAPGADTARDAEDSGIDTKSEASVGGNDSDLFRASSSPGRRLRGGLKHLWGAHEGHKDCTGSNQLGCYFGIPGLNIQNSKPKPAAGSPSRKLDTSTLHVTVATMFCTCMPNTLLEKSGRHRCRMRARRSPVKL